MIAHPTQELEIWVTALERLDAHQYDEAITVFEPIADTSKILFNCGVIRATIGEHEAAVGRIDGVSISPADISDRSPTFSEQ